MEKFITFLAVGLLIHPISAQVGIGTSDPQATLDVRGNIKVSSVPISTTVANYHILAMNDANTEVSMVTPQTLFAATTNTTIYAAKKTTGISLLSLALFPTGFRAVNFLQTERTLGTAALFNDTDNTYTVPSTGIYAVGFSFKYGNGIQASILTNSPGVGIVLNRAGSGSILDSKPFSAANLVVLSLTISESHINSMYSLQAGDKISFGLTGSTLLDVGLISSSTASFFVYKVSN